MLIKIDLLIYGIYLGYNMQQNSFNYQIILNFNDEKLYFLQIDYHRTSLWQLY